VEDLVEDSADDEGREGSIKKGRRKVSRATRLTMWLARPTASGRSWCMMRRDGWWIVASGVYCHVSAKLLIGHLARQFLPHQLQAVDHSQALV